MTTSRDAGDDLLRILDELDELISNARSMPMSASAIVNRENALHLIDRARDAVPTAVRRAEKIVADADAVLAEGRAESERLVQYAQEESERLVAGENIVRMANDRADSIVAAASLEAEVAKVAEQIRAGREVLAGRLGDGAGQPVEIQEPVRRRSAWSVDPSAH